MFKLDHSSHGKDPIAFLQSIRTMMSSLKIDNHTPPLLSPSFHALHMHSIAELVDTRALLKILWLELLALDDQCLPSPLDETISAEALDLNEMYDNQQLSEILIRGMTELSSEFSPFPANWTIKNRKYGLLLKRIYYDLWEIDFQYKQLKNLIQNESVSVIFERYCNNLEKFKNIDALKNEFLLLLDVLDLQSLKPEIQAIQTPTVLKIIDQIVDIQEREKGLMPNQDNISCEQFLIESFQLYKEIGNLLQTIQLYFTEPSNQVPPVFLKQRMLKSVTFIFNNQVKIDANKFYTSNEYQNTLLFQALEQCHSTLLSLVNHHANDFINETLMHNFQQRNTHDRAALKLFLHFCVGKQPFFAAVEHLFEVFDREKFRQLEQTIHQQASEIQALKQEIEALKQQKSSTSGSASRQRRTSSTDGLSRSPRSISPTPTVALSIVGQSIFSPTPPFSQAAHSSSAHKRRPVMKRL